MSLFGCDYLDTRSSFLTTEYICKRTMKQIDSRTAQEICMTGRYQECYDYKNGSWCFITTAVCLTMGKPDDCEELTQMRRFRDEWLKEQSDGPELIADYYHIAPSIVASIDKLENRKQIFSDIYSKYIVPCVEFAKQNNFEACKRIYIKMVDVLEAKYFKKEESI